MVARAEPLLRQPAQGDVAPARAGPVSPPDAQRVAQWKRQVLVAILGAIGAIPCMGAMVAIGHADGLAVAVWAPFSVAPSLLVYLGLQRGWTMHLRDPTCTAWQINCSITSCIACYAIAGPMRALTLPMVCLSVIFAIFALPPRQVRWITTYAIVTLAATMALMSHWQPARYPVAEELLSFAVMGLVLPSFAVLTERLSQLRHRLGRQKVELEQALRRNAELAETDMLTGLVNRRRATELLQMLSRQAERGRGYALALADIDHFKQVNDRHGHAVGDRVLQQFAQLARESVRGGDVVARWGGEEFVLLLPCDDAPAALQVAQRLRERTAASALELADGATLHFTVSVGLTLHQAGEAPQDTLSRADAAMYEAKAEGRNRVQLA